MITILSTPTTYASANEDLWFVVSSDNTGESNFKFVFDVWVNSELVSRSKVYPDVENSKGLFNAKHVVRGYTSYFKPSGSSAFQYDGTDIYKEYQVRFGEEFDSVTYLNLTNATYKAYNFYHPLFWDRSTDYLSGFVNDWLTNRNRRTLEGAFDENLFVSFLTGTLVDPSCTLKIQKYLENGTASGSPVEGSEVDCDPFILLNISPTAVNNYLSYEFIDDSTYSYGVVLSNETGDSDELRVNLTCNRYTPAVVHFLNSLGGYETYSFRLINRNKRNVETKSYNRLNSELVSDTMRQYDTYNRVIPGSIAYVKEISQSFTLVGDYVNETDYQWLSELIQSPEVYLERDGYYYPIIVKTTNYEEKIQVADKLFNVTLDVDMGIKQNSQIR